MAGTRIKKNDLIKVISGKNKGATGKVQVVDTKSSTVIVAGVNMVKKTVKKKSQQEQGGIISIEAPLHISNVQLVSKSNTSRVGYKIENDKKVRYAKKTGEGL